MSDSQQTEERTPPDPPTASPPPADDKSRPARARRGRGVRRAVIGLVVVGVFAAGGWYANQAGWLERMADQLGGEEAQAAAKPKLPPATAEVTERTLVETEEAEGTLGYGDEQELSGGGGAQGGVITKLAAEGRTVKRGETLYRVNDEPVVLLSGKLPLYRTLVDGIEDGPDIKQLEKNLDALGYGEDLVIDQEFTGATTEAIEQWQDDLGLEETGRIEPGQVVVLPEAVRVASHQMRPGDQAGPGQPVFSYTGTDRMVTIDLEVDDRELVHEGDDVTVELPDGTEVDGTISEVSSVAESSASDDSGVAGGESSAEDATIEVTVDVPDGKATEGFDQAPVDVALTSDEREDVLTVPVMALLALSEGGYGVEVVPGAGQGKTSEIVPVDLGMFAEGQVEVSGPGLEAGTKVGVPAS